MSTRRMTDTWLELYRALSGGLATLQSAGLRHPTERGVPSADDGGLPPSTIA